MWFPIRWVLFPVKWALKILAPICLLMVAGVMAYLFFWLPDVSILATQRPETTAFIESTRDRFQREGHQRTIRWKWVDLENISPTLVEAVLIAEDDRFYLHRGFDFTEILNAVETNLRENRLVRGGSTITQQLAKNLYLSSERTYLRKLNEALLTWKLEHSLSKDRILEIYLNVIEWGEGIFGVEEASLFYFKKHASELTERESVSLAARIPDPREIGNRPLERRQRREKRILARLMETPPGRRGTQRTHHLARSSKKSSGSSGRHFPLDSSSLAKVGKLAQKQMDTWWEKFSKTKEPDWKIPEPIDRVRMPRETLRQIAVEPLRTVRSASPEEKRTPPEVEIPSTHRNRADSNRSRLLPRKPARRSIDPASSGTTVVKPPPRANPPIRENRETRRSRDFRERLARLEKLLSQ